MVRRIDIRTWILSAGVILPLITILLFGFAGNGAGTKTLHPWISGAAAACAEGIILFFMLRIMRDTKRYVRTPFYIASGVVVGIYAITVFLEIVLFGYWFKLTEESYIYIHFFTFFLSAIVLGLISLAGRYVLSSENKGNFPSSIQNDTVARISSIRIQLASIETERNQMLDKLMFELEESFRYSDPLTDESSDHIEDMIRQKISILENQIKLMAEAEHDQQMILIDEIDQQIHEILNILMERNTERIRIKASS